MGSREFYFCKSFWPLVKFWKHLARKCDFLSTQVSYWFNSNSWGSALAMTIFYVSISFVSDQYFEYINWSEVSPFLNCTFLCVCPLCDINYSTVCITWLHTSTVLPVKLVIKYLPYIHRNAISTLSKCFALIKSTKIY